MLINIPGSIFLRTLELLVEAVLGLEHPTLAVDNCLTLNIRLVIVSIRRRAAATTYSAKGPCAFGQSLPVSSVEAVNNLLLPRTLVFGPRQHHDHSLVLKLVFFINRTDCHFSAVQCFLSLREDNFIPLP